MFSGSGPLVLLTTKFNIHRGGWKRSWHHKPEVFSAVISHSASAAIYASGERNSMRMRCCFGYRQRILQLGSLEIRTISTARRSSIWVPFEVIHVWSKPVRIVLVSSRVIWRQIDRAL